MSKRQASKPWWFGGSSGTGPIGRRVATARCLRGRTFKAPTLSPPARTSPLLTPNSHCHVVNPTRDLTNRSIAVNTSRHCVALNLSAYAF